MKSGIHYTANHLAKQVETVTRYFVGPTLTDHQHLLRQYLLRSLALSEPSYQNWTRDTLWWQTDKNLE